MNAPSETPLELAAQAAEAEADSLHSEAQHAMALEDTSALLYDMATDAINAYGRARDRARAAQLLADHDRGIYNAWQRSNMAGQNG
jgi:hypothetical protein